MINRLLIIVLVLASNAIAQTAIYRSVKNTTSTIFTSGASINLTISSGTATFSSAAPDSIGVGCAIQYDDDSDGDIDASDSICFIHARASSTSFTVKNAAGSNPTDVANDQDWSTFYAYLNINNAENRTENTGIDADLRDFDSGSTRDISSGVNNEQWHYAIYRGDAGGGGTGWGTTDWTCGTNAANYIRFYAPYLISEIGVSQRHEGIRSTSRANVALSSGAGSALIFWPSQGKFEGLQILFNSGGAGASIGLRIDLNLTSENIDVTDCIFDINGSGSGGTPNAIGIQVIDHAGTVNISNTLIIDAVEGDGVDGDGILVDEVTAASTITMRVSNCTLVNCYRGIRRVDNTVIVKNTLVNGTILANSAFVGTFDAASDYNSTDDATVPGPNSRANQTFTLDANFALTSADVGALNFGTDLSGDSNLPITDDIIQVARPQGVAYDIGAFELIQAAIARRKWIIK